MLPHGSGLALAGVAAEKNIPVLMISGHQDGQTMCERLDIAWLEKPFGLDSLILVLEAVLADKTEAVRRAKAAVTKLRDAVE
jgi:DNA-binding response OmpR family regulator